MKPTRLIWVVALLMLAGHTPLFAQSQLVSTPDASPKAAVYQRIGMTDVKVVYHRPAVRERQIWGALVPYGAVWRAGANDNTIIKVSNDVRIEGLDLPAGVYGLHILPKGEKAEVIFSKNYTAWGSFSYDPEEDALRVEISPKSAEHHEERLAYYFTDLDEDEATLVLHWEKKIFAIRISSVNFEQEVLAELRKDLQNRAGWSWRGYFEAANWCLQNEVAEQEALGWATRSVAMFPNPQNMITKARLAGMVKGAAHYESVEDMALDVLAEDLATLPVTWREWNAAANYALNNEAMEQAAAWSEIAAKQDANMSTLMTHSRVMKAGGDKKAAEKYREKAIMAGSNAQLNAYGYQLLASGQTGEAVEVFLVNTEKHPEDPNVWDSLGEGYYHHGDHEKAIESLRKSLSMNPPANVKANSLKLLGIMGVDVGDIQP